MSNSILLSIKKLLSLPEDYTVFDDIVLIHINTVFSTLTQLGVGPDEGFFVEDEDDLWAEFLGTDPRLNQVKSYVGLRVRLLFDPPQLSFMITSIEREVKEMEWRLNVHREGEKWTDPNPPETSG